MKYINLNIEEKRSELIAFIGKLKHLVLATCAEGRVTARTMSYVNIGLDIYFGTDNRFLKVNQIKQNPKVAICIENLQIEGTAEIMGHPSRPENTEFCEAYKQKNPRSFEMYTMTKNEVVIKVTPHFFTQWKYIDGKACREFYDPAKNVSFREFYEVIY